MLSSSPVSGSRSRDWFRRCFVIYRGAIDHKLDRARRTPAKMSTERQRPQEIDKLLVSPIEICSSTDANESFDPVRQCLSSSLAWTRERNQHRRQFLRFPLFSPAEPKSGSLEPFAILSSAKIGFEYLNLQTGTISGHLVSIGAQVSEVKSLRRKRKQEAQKFLTLFGVYLPPVGLPVKPATIHSSRFTGTILRTVQQ